MASPFTPAREGNEEREIDSSPFTPASAPESSPFTPAPVSGAAPQGVSPFSPASGGAPAPSPSPSPSPFSLEPPAVSAEETWLDVLATAPQTLQLGVQQWISGVGRQIGREMQRFDQGEKTPAAAAKRISQTDSLFEGFTEFVASLADAPAMLMGAMNPLTDAVRLANEAYGNREGGPLTKAGKNLEDSSAAWGQRIDEEFLKTLGEDPSFAKQVSASVGTSLGFTLPSLVTGIATRGNSFWTLSPLAYITQASSEARALDEGKTLATSRVFGMLDGLIEAGTEAIPMKRLLAGPVGERFLKKLGAFLVREVPSELAATTLQDLNEWVFVNEDMTPEQFLEKLGNDLTLTLVATPISGGIQAGVAHTGQRVAEFLSDKTYSPTPGITEEDIRTLADAAGISETQQETLENVLEGARDPDSWLQEIEEASGQPNFPLLDTLEVSRKTEQERISESVRELILRPPEDRATENTSDILERFLPQEEMDTAFEEQELLQVQLETNGIVIPSRQEALERFDAGERLFKFNENTGKYQEVKDRDTAQMSLNLTALPRDVLGTPENLPEAPQFPDSTPFDLTDENNLLPGEDDGSGRFDPPPQRRRKDPFPSRHRRDLDKFNRYSKLFHGLRLIAEKNRHIPGVERYDRTVTELWADKTKWVNRANNRVWDWLDTVPQRKMDRFNDYLLFVDRFTDQQKRAITDEQELLSLAHENGFTELGEQDIRVAKEIWGDYRSALNSMEQALLNTIVDQQRHGQLQDEEAARKLREIENTFRIMRNRNFIPRSRFGKYTLTVHANKPGVKYEGFEAEEAGDVLYFERFESLRKRNAALEHWKKRGKDFIPRPGQIKDDTVESILSVPPQLADMLEERLDLSEAQRSELERIRVELAPTESIRKRFIERKDTPGFSRDFVRGYADYFTRFSNHIARLTHNAELNRALEQVERSAYRDLGSEDNNTRIEISNWLRRHKEYLDNPGEEWAVLRSAGFLWYLGAVPKSAAVNLTQTAMTTYPHLANEFGDVEAMREIVRSIKRYSQFWQKGKRWTKQEQQMLTELLRRGILNESNASELAGIAEGGMLHKMTQSHAPARFTAEMSRRAAFLFHHAEVANRHIAALSSYNLARKKGVSHKEAIEYAHRTLDATQFEYARFNRPELFRGRKSVAFIFMQYMTNMLHFLNPRHGRGASARSLLVLTALGGLAGLPFAEDIMNLIDTVVKIGGRALGIEPGAFNLEQEIREYIQEVNELTPEWMRINPDLVLHGRARKLGPWDISGSLSMGRIIPGVEAVEALLTGTERSTQAFVGESLAEAGGAMASVPVNFLQAIGSNSPDIWRKWEMAMPSTVRNISRATRWATRGEETDRTGRVVAEFDRSSLRGWAEILGQGAGFAPTRVNKQKEAEFIAREATLYYEARKRTLLQALNYARATRGDTKEPMAAIRDYNKSVPHWTLKIGPESLTRSAKRAAKDRALREAGVHPERQYRGLYKEVLESFDLDESE